MIGGIFVGHVLLALGLSLELVSSQEIIPIYVIPGNGSGQCAADQLIENAKNNITSEVSNLLGIITTSLNCGEGDWQQVGNLNMRDPTQQCPSGWQEFGPIRTCARSRDLHLLGANCVSTVFNTSGRQYSKVCGRAVGYQYWSTDAFNRLIPQPTGTPDDNYVDGLSVTHGSNPRQHIWTFATGAYEAREDIRGHPATVCPCAAPGNSVFGTPPPSYVGNNYFCETGNPNTIYEEIQYPDPLWDGQGCTVHSECCTFNSPPWFSVTLPNPTTDDIEARICADQADDDTTIEVLELYIA